MGVRRQPAAGLLGVGAWVALSESGQERERVKALGDSEALGPWDCAADCQCSGVNVDRPSASGRVASAPTGPLRPAGDPVRVHVLDGLARASFLCVGLEAAPASRLKEDKFSFRKEA
jgi:hypothetical protein